MRWNGVDEVDEWLASTKGIDRRRLGGEEQIAGWNKMNIQ